MKKQQANTATKPPLTLEQKTANFCKTVEAGDMVLFDVIDSSIAVFGYTRVGKTTSCHLLCRSPLRAENKAGELIYVPSTRKFDTAIVGTGHESETQIPNIFQTMVREGTGVKNITVLDQPGYGDTYGFHRIFSNGYFHYRTFSKTKKLKFVLAIWMNDLRGTAEKFRFTIRNFINTFTNWDEVKKDILKASSILITRADPQINQNTLIDIIKTLRDVVGSFGNTQKARYQQFVDHMVAQKKIFFVTKPTQANQKAQDNTTLQKIYDKTQFWQRQLIGKNIVDMSQIKFSVTTQILNRLRDPNDQSFRQEFVHYMKFTQQRLDGMILNHRGSLQNIIQILQEDAKSSNQSHNFLDAMQDFNQTYYNFLENFSKKRETIIANLFKNAQNEALNQSVDTFAKEVKNVYFVKKFKVLEYLVEFNQRIMDLGIMADRSIEQLEEYSNNFLLIFKKFSILGINKNDKENIIYKYSYSMQRLIEESKILTLILFCKDGDRGEFEQMGLTVSEDIFRMLFDRFFTPILGEINLDQLKLDFIKNMDFSTLVSVNDEILNFLQSMPLKTQEIEFKITQLIIEFQKNLFKDEANPQNERKKYILKKLYVYRNKFYSFWQNLRSGGSLDMIQKCSETIVNLTKSLANVLYNMNLYSQARQTYRTINDADSIFRIYELEGLHINKDRQLYRSLLIKYAADASIYYRKEKAIECYQKAFSLSANIAQAKQISNLIVNTCTQKKEDIQDDPYLSRLFNFDQKFFQDLPQNVKLYIEDECDLDD